MKEKIEKRIKQHIETIIKKEYLDVSDYQTLVAELGRLETIEKSQKWENETEERNERLAQLMSVAFAK